MKYKLIVSDIDGTLITDGGPVAKETKRLVSEYQKKGGLFTVGTGRMEKAVKAIMEALDTDTPAIVYNGSSVINIKTNVAIYEAKLNDDVAKLALKIYQDHGLDAILYIDQVAYVAKITPAIASHIEKEEVGCVEVNDLYNFLDKAPTKILFIGDEEKFSAFQNKLESKKMSPLNFICSEHNYLELLPEGVSKGQALKILAESLEIPIEETIAIGDERNDVSMIEAAGLGVAVQNAKPELLAKANYVTQGNANKGVEEILHKVINPMC